MFMTCDYTIFLCLLVLVNGQVINFRVNGMPLFTFNVTIFDRALLVAIVAKCSDSRAEVIHGCQFRPAPENQAAIAKNMECRLYSEQRARLQSIVTIVLFAFAGLKLFRPIQTVAGLWDVG